MIVSKNSQTPTPEATPSTSSKITTMEEAYKVNALTEAYKAVRKILEGIKVDDTDANSPRLFRTIKLDTGQLARLKNNKHNQEYLFACPAVLIHYVDLYYNVGTSQISEGKGVMRIHFILNTLNNEDDDIEAQGFEVFNKINQAIQAHKAEFPALVTKFQLAYFDMPETFDDGLQPFWIDYTIWFNEYSAYRYKDYKECYIVTPPFTNHSDQTEGHNVHGHANHPTPTYEQSSGITTPSDE